MQQQERFEDFIRVYNHEPPQDPDYPFHDRTIRVTRCGRICLGNRKINLSVALAEQLVGIHEIDDKFWQVSFLQYDLGYFDQDEDRVEPDHNPFAPDTLLMENDVSGMDRVARKLIELLKAE